MNSDKMNGFNYYNETRNTHTFARVNKITPQKQGHKRGVLMHCWSQENETNANILLENIIVCSYLEYLSI